MRFSRSPPLPMIIALVGVALDDDGRGDAAQVALLLVPVDDDGRGVGQLVAGQAEQLLAHDLGGEEAVAAVGERVFLVAARAAPAGTARRSPSSRSASAALVAVIGTNSAKAWRACIGCSQGASSARRATVSSLLATSSTGLPRVDQREHRRVVRRRSGRPRPRAARRRRRTSVPVTARFSERLSAATWRVWKPGVSTNTNCASPRCGCR